jgi:hypothetical protein
VDADAVRIEESRECRCSTRPQTLSRLLYLGLPLGDMLVSFTLSTASEARTANSSSRL